MFGEIRVGGRVIQVMVGGKDLGYPRAERVDPPNHGLCLRCVHHRGLPGFVTHEEVGVVVPERGDPLDNQRHAVEASGHARELPLARWDRSDPVAASESDGFASQAEPNRLRRRK